MRPLTFAKGKHYIGIDLGTTFSAAAYLDAQGQPVTIPNAENELTTPSVVLFEPGGDIVVGREARQAALTDPGRVADAVKREVELEGYVAALQAKRREMEEAFQSMLLARARSAQEAGDTSTPEGGPSVTRRVENATGAFDPNVHEAISMEPNDDVPSGEIIAEVRRGYMLDGKVLRPSFVRVSQ